MSIKTATLLTLIMLTIDTRAMAQPTPWVTAYYALWSVPSLYPEDIDYRKLTHIVHFSANPVKRYPYLDVSVPAAEGKYNQDSVNVQWGGNYNGNNPPLWRTIDIQNALISAAHKNGVKVVLSVGGIYGVGREAMQWISQDDNRIEVFTRESCAYARRKGYDGIEIDWEHPYAIDTTGYAKLILRFKRELDAWKPRGLLVTAVNCTPWKSLGFVKDAMLKEQFDQINLMTYEMYGGDFSNVKTGYNSPMEVSTEFSGYNGDAINQRGRSVDAWVAFGIPKSKLGLGISFLTTEFYNVAQPVQPAQKFKTHNWGYLKNVPQAGRHWDQLAMVPWQASGNTFITFEDSASVRIKVEYAQRNNLGGLMLYDLLGGYLPKAPPGQKNPLLEAVDSSLRRFKNPDVR